MSLGVGAAVVAELSRGIQQVIHDEFPLQARRTEAERLYGIGNSLLSESKILTQKQRIVHNAANAARRSFQMNGIKAEIKSSFEHLIESGIESITADHGSFEDDELLALVQQVSQEKNYNIDKIVGMFQRYYKQYLEADKNEKSSGITNEQRTVIEQNILSFMREGYSFLASLGEEIRGTPILYEVTVTFGDGSHKSGWFTLEELMNNTYLEMHRGTFQLRLGSTANLKMYEWTSEVNSRYAAWKNSELISSQGWNEGELIERFREESTYIFNEELERALGMKPEQIAGLDPHGRHYLIHSSLNLSYTKGPDFFASIDKLFDSILYGSEQERVRNEILAKASSISVNGIDYVGIQEKSEGATFTNLNGLVRSLKQVSINLSKLAGAIDVKNQIKDMDDIDAGVEKAAIDLVRQFLPG